MLVHMSTPCSMPSTPRLCCIVSFSRSHETRRFAQHPGCATGNAIARASNATARGQRLRRSLSSRRNDVQVTPPGADPYRSEVNYSPHLCVATERVARHASRKNRGRGSATVLAKLPPQGSCERRDRRMERDWQAPQGLAAGAEAATARRWRSQSLASICSSYSDLPTGHAALPSGRPPSIDIVH